MNNCMTLYNMYIGVSLFCSATLWNFPYEKVSVLQALYYTNRTCWPFTLTLDGSHYINVALIWVTIMFTAHSQCLFENTSCYCQLRTSSCDSCLSAGQACLQVLKCSHSREFCVNRVSTSPSYFLCLFTLLLFLPFLLTFLSAAACWAGSTEQSGMWLWRTCWSSCNCFCKVWISYFIVVLLHSHCCISYKYNSKL